MSDERVAPQHTTAVMRTQKDVQALLESEQFKRAVKAALPSHLSPDRFVRVALTAMMRTPNLRQCTQESLFKCLLDCSALGLEPDGRRAHLIPYGRECTLIVDYKGIAELVRRSGDVSYIHADVVCPEDEFDYGYGSGAFLKHKPNLEIERDPKTVKCAYSFVKLKDGSEDFMVIGRAEIEKVRKRSKAASNGPWVTDWSEMAKKTVFRRHSKWLPLSPETHEAIEKDDDAVDVRLADTPDGDPAWLEVGSAKAADAVAEQKIAQMEKESAAERDARIQRQIENQTEATRQMQARAPANAGRPQGADTGDGPPFTDEDNRRLDAEIQRQDGPAIVPPDESKSKARPVFGRRSQ